MNIKQAIGQVESARAEIARLDNAAERISGYGDAVHAGIETYATGGIRLPLDREHCLDLIRKSKAHYESEIAKLQPVIDMANAALKGLMS